nr:hypothetical protein [Tanacetum cinerariifolium]
MIKENVDVAIATERARQANVRNDASASGPVMGQDATPVVRECTFVRFMKCNHALFHVDEDEEPVEEEFKEEEDPQEEEDDMEVDIDEDENKPELTCPYEKVDPLKPLPPASESKPKDVTEAENLIEHEDETVPASVHVIASILRWMYGHETTYALVEKKGKAKNKYYGKLILDLSNEVCSSVEQGTTAMERLVKKLGNAKDKAECKKLKKELEETRLSNTFLCMQNKRVERGFYWTRVRAHKFYQEMICRGIVFEEKPNETIEVLVKDEEPAIRRMIKENVDVAIATERARQANVRNDASASGPVMGQDATPVVRECTFVGFMKCNHAGKKVKFSVATLQGPALTWWNAKPANLNEAVRMAHKLMQQKSQGRDERILEGKKRKWESLQGGNSSGKVTGASTQSIPTCYDCGEKGHTKNQCPRKVKQEKVREVSGRAYAVKDAEPKGPNVVTSIIMPPKSAPMTQAVIHRMIKDNDAAFHGVEGAVELQRWLEKTESVFEISECAEGKKVKFAVDTPEGTALTWWKTKVATMGLEMVNQMPWTEMKQLMTAKVLSNRRNSKNGARIMELEERVKVDAYIRGLPDNIKGEVTSSKPANLNEAVRMAHKLMQQKSQGRDERILEGKNRKWESFQGGNSSGKRNHKDNLRQTLQNNQKQGNARAMVTALIDGNVSSRSLPLCERCFTRHVGPCHTRNRCPRKVKQEEVRKVRGRAYAVKDAKPKGPNVVTGDVALRKTKEGQEDCPGAPPGTTIRSVLRSTQGRARPKDKETLMKNLADKVKHDEKIPNNQQEEEQLNEELTAKADPEEVLGRKLWKEHSQDVIKNMHKLPKATYEGLSTIMDID